MLFPHGKGVMAARTIVPPAGPLSPTMKLVAVGVFVYVPTGGAASVALPEQADTANTNKAILRTKYIVGRNKEQASIGYKGIVVANSAISVKRPVGRIWFL